MKMLKSKRGFTLLELLMVIIVVGILASLAIPQYQSFVEKSRTTEAVNMIAAIKSAQMLFKLEDGTNFASSTGALTDYITISDTDNWWFTTDANSVTATRNGGGSYTGDTIIWTLADGGGSWSNASSHDLAPTS